MTDMSAKDSDVPDLLGAWASSSASSSAAPAQAPADDGDDLLGAWAKTVPQPEGPAAKKVLRLTVHPAGTKPDKASPRSEGAKPEETLSQYVNRLLGEHGADTLTDKTIRFGAGAARGVGDVADTLAQGIGYAGEQGARALSGAGVISPDSAQAVSDWRARINADIAADNARFAEAANDSSAAQIGRLGGQIAGTAPFLAASGGLISAATRGAPIVNALAARPLVSAAVRGAGAGAGASALTSAASEEPLGDQITSGATAGAVLGPAGRLVSGVARKVAGAGVEPETAQLAATARDKFGIPIRPDQISTNPMVRFMGSVMQRLPFTGMGEHVAEQQTAFNRAIANEFGETADKVTRPVLARAATRIGGMFDSVASRTGQIAIDRPFMSDVGRIVNDARSVLGRDAGPIENQVRRIADRIDFGTNSLSADSYQSLTRKGTPLDRAIHSADPNVRFYAGQIRDALDDAMERSAPADVVADLKQARYQWAIMKAIEPLAHDAPTGDISVAKVLRAATGGNLDELGQIGQRFLKEPPSSGTAERLTAIKTIGALAGGVGGLSYFDPEHFQRDVAGLGAGLLAARAGGAALRSNALTGALIRGGQRQALGAGNAMAPRTRLPITPALGALALRPASASTR
jgi:hypothetical protein